MLTFPFHLLLMVMSLLIVIVRPEPISPDSWKPPPNIPTPPNPPVNDRRRIFDTTGDNTTEVQPDSMEAYCQMLLQGPNPEDIPWFCYCTQCQSNPGPKGDRGDRGLPGSPGSPGMRGLTGPRGPPGFMGRPGIKGQKGDNGEKGQQGPTGLMGPKGTRGFKGDKGDQGVEGVPGDQGPKGDDGVCPDTCDSSNGPPGAPGLPGPAGPRGLPGTPGPVGPKGNKGDDGDLGPPGAPGPVGSKGELGPQGECNCTDGVDGSPGQKGAKGDKGEQGQAGPTGQIGIQGNTGDPGPIGMMGLPGPCMPSIQSAFAARLMSNYPPPNTPVVFSQILYNDQGHYSPTSGIYSAPANGTYVFSYHLTVYERVLKVGLFHNYVPVVKTTDTKMLGVTSHSVVLHLAWGDKVWIQVKDSVTNGMYAGTEYSSTFSGFLLHPDRCDMISPRNIPPNNDARSYSWV